jgi:predicted secreted hydrolase
MSYKEKFKPLKFPRDEQKHNHIIEWWYFNGNLETQDGRSFSYMNTLFATKPNLVKIPFLKNIPLKTLFFSHYLLSDNANHKFWDKVNPLCLLDHNSFSKPLLWISYDNSCLIEESKLFNFHIVNDFVDLTLKAVKKPLLINGKGFIDLGVKTAYYYSLTHLQTRGLIRIKDKWIPANGLSWMDHQWAQTPMTQDDKWTWFSLQLNNGWDIMAVIYGDKVKTAHASMVDKNNNSKTTNNVFFKPLPPKYLSKETGAEYQLGYEIFLPDWNLKLTAKPCNKAQEMIFGTINYWEGGMDIQGQLNDKKIRGQGFLELVGSPMKKSLMRVYLNKFEKSGLKDLKESVLDKMKIYR